LKYQLRFQEFDGEWEKKTLFDISKDVSYGMNAASKSFDGIHKYLRITDIDADTRKFNPNPLTSPEGFIDKKFKLKENDLLFTRTGASVGKSYLYDSKDGDLYYAGFLIKFNIVKANSYFETAILQSGNKSFLKLKEFKNNKKEFVGLSNKISMLDNIFQKKINNTYKNKIDSLYILDQSYREKNQSTEKIDDSNFSLLLSLIYEYGFPSEEKIGYESYKRANIILHHNLRLTKNEKYLNIFFEKYVRNGEYRPEDYAWTLEQNRVWFNKSTPIYYFLILPTKNLTHEQKEKINLTRREIGLKPLEAFKENKNSFQTIW
jgi:hypothetical protein